MGTADSAEACEVGESRAVPARVGLGMVGAPVGSVLVSGRAVAGADGGRWDLR